MNKYPKHPNNIVEYMPCSNPRKVELAIMWSKIVIVFGFILGCFFFWKGRK